MDFPTQVYASEQDIFYDCDDAPSQSLAHSAEAAKLLAWHRQELIASEMSRMVSEEYLEDILVHLYQLEDETLPDLHLIDTQKEIQWFMRPHLLDFLIETHGMFRLLPETLFLTINILDRYCSRRIVFRHHYQLVGASALLIAAKFADKKDNVPQIAELASMCGNMYASDMFTQMEMHILQTLEWAVNCPTADFFTKLIAMEEHDDMEVQHMAAYLAEIALYHREFVVVKPSVMARSTLVLARAILGRPEVMDSNWGPADHMTIVALSQRLHQPSRTLIAKYALTRYSRVSFRLAEIIRYHEAMAARQWAAASHQTSSVQSHSGTTTTNSEGSFCATPMSSIGMNKGLGGTIDGYITPPITPDFYNNNNNNNNGNGNGNASNNVATNGSQQHALSVSNHKSHAYVPASHPHHLFPQYPATPALAQQQQQQQQQHQQQPPPGFSVAMQNQVPPHHQQQHYPQLCHNGPEPSHSNHLSMANAYAHQQMQAQAPVQTQYGTVSHSEDMLY